MLIPHPSAILFVPPMGNSGRESGAVATGMMEDLVRRSHSEGAGDGVKIMNVNVQKEKELELIAAILAGDAQLYHQLIRPYERSVYIMSLSCMKNVKDAEDVARETFVKAYRNLWAFQGDSGFNAWLISIALNEARSRPRRQTPIQIASFDKPQSEEIPVTPILLRGWRELPCEIIEREEIRGLLRQAVEMLGDVQQQVFLLHDVEEFNVSDIAQILNIKASLVKGSLDRARMLLQRFLVPKLNVTSSASAHRDEPSH
jgi:RNA polymerase sigma-70 factor (ECF subfamily)